MISPGYCETSLSLSKQQPAVHRRMLDLTSSNYFNTHKPVSHYICTSARSTPVWRRTWSNQSWSSNRPVTVHIYTNNIESTGYFTHHAGFTVKHSTFSPQRVFTCFVYTNPFTPLINAWLAQRRYDKPHNPWTNVCGHFPHWILPKSEVKYRKHGRSIFFFHALQ